MSWPLILLGALGMVIFHSMELFRKQNKSPLDYSRQFLIIAFLGTSLSGVFQIQYAETLSILTKTALIVFLVVYIKEIVSSLHGNSDSNNLVAYFSTEKLSLLLADLATVYIVIASLFKILNWEFGIITSNLLLVIGLFTAVISILAGSRSIKG